MISNTQRNWHKVVTSQDLKRPREICISMYPSHWQLCYKSSKQKNVYIRTSPTNLSILLHGFVLHGHTSISTKVIAALAIKRIVDSKKLLSNGWIFHPTLDDRQDGTNDEMSISIYTVRAIKATF